MTMNKQDDAGSQPGEVRSSDQLGLDSERAAFERWMSDGGKWQKAVERYGGGAYVLAQTAAAWGAWQAAAASVRERDATPDQIIELSEALQVRRILEEIKKVSAIHPADDMPTPFQSAWHTCCEEIFYRATGEQWHMDEDAEKFKRRAANEPQA